MQEIELKLSLAPAAAQRAPAILDQLFGPSQAVQSLDSAYYDTPEGSLRRQRIALRLRRQDAQWIQTLKGGGGVAGGVHSRDEWNWPLPDNQLNVALLRTAGWNEGIDTARLAPVFSTRFTRRVWWLDEPAYTIEVALDLGEVTDGAALSAPLCEIELELKRGEASSLFAQAERLAREVPVWLGFVSKAQKGYTLVRPDQVLLSRPPQPSLGQPAANLDLALRAFSLWLDIHIGKAVPDAPTVPPGVMLLDYLQHLQTLRVRLSDHAGVSQRALDELGQWLTMASAEALDWLVRFPGEIGVERSNETNPRTSPGTKDGAHEGTADFDTCLRQTCWPGRIGVGLAAAAAAANGAGHSADRGEP